MTNADGDSLLPSSNAEAIRELVPFLGNPRPELRKTGVDLVLQLTATEEGVRELKKTEVARLLCRLLGDLNKIAEPALKALVNLSSDTDVVSKLLSYGVMNSMMNALSEKECKTVELMTMLLANLTVNEEGARKLLQTDQDKLQGLHARKLIRWYLDNKPESGERVDYSRKDTEFKDDEWRYIANVLANITQVEEGRDLIRRRSSGILVDLLPELLSPNPIRRRGIAATIRNLCFIEEDHYYYYTEFGLITHLLYPLAGPEELDVEDKKGLSYLVIRDGDKKQREPDATVRRLIIETLLLMCVTRAGRKALRRQKVYPIVRNAHLVEDDEDVEAEIYKLVDFLIRDEEGEGPDLDKLQAETEKHSAEEPTQASTASSAARVASTPTPAPITFSPTDAPIPTGKTKAQDRFEDVQVQAVDETLANEDEDEDDDFDDLPDLVSVKPLLSSFPTKATISDSKPLETNDRIAVDELD